MPSFWITFKGRNSACVEAEDEKTAMVAARIASGAQPIKAETLPHPADPRLVTKSYKDPKGREYNIPSFCYTPEKCAGDSCCHKQPSCVD